MSETITEMILPGTYIDVRAEGLIGVGGISTGNIGVVGTANKGPVNEVQLLGSFAEARDAFGTYDAFDPKAETPSLTLARSLEQIFRGGGSTVYAVRIANVAEDQTMGSATFDIQDQAPATIFQLVAKSPGTWANSITAILKAPDGDPVTLILQLGSQKETFTGLNAGELADEIEDGSNLVNVTGLAEDQRNALPESVTQSAQGGPDGASVGNAQVTAGLNALATQPVNIVTVGGLDLKTVSAPVLSHLEATENDARERMAVIGASTDDPAKVISDDVSKGSTPRLILVAPGLTVEDSASTKKDKKVDLPPPYAAALVAGRLATLAPQVSLTNKIVAAPGLSTEYTRAQQKQLLQQRVLVLHQNLGSRVLKGITTDTGAFKQISVRRIVDYAKEGVRQGSNPYIGRLNNARVRAALKATLDGFLSNMVLDEQLTEYTLDVTATRAQEIAGVALVTMTLKPTFSIDFVKVIMNLE